MSKLQDKKNRTKRYKFISEEAYADVSPTYNSKFIHNLRQFKNDQLKLTRALRSKASVRREKREQIKKEKGIEIIDWDDLDVITFNPNTKRHKNHLKILKLNPRNEKRKQLVKRLESEFCRLYSRYRRAVERSNGRATARYEIYDGERKYAAAAAVLCIQRGVTPRQVMEYWSKQIKYFSKNSTMKIPSLSFLSSPANIDTVACSVVYEGDSKTNRQIQEPVIKPKHGNSFSDTTGLDMRLRKELEKAGFKTTEYNDRYLLTVQKNAIALSMGKNIFIGSGPLRDMSIWASKNLFGERKKKK